MSDITPEALEARGFEPCDKWGWVRRIPGTVEEITIGTDNDGLLVLLWTGPESIELPGIRTLADVDAMIRFLEGGA